MSEAVTFGVFGLIVGSFLNVLILRWGKRPLTGRSSCETCGETIAWHDLIPILSWVMLRGRCRLCSAPISVQYPLVEGMTAALFILIGLSPLPLYLRLFALPIAATLLAIAVYDLHHKIIPDGWVFTFAGLALFNSFFPITSPGSFDAFLTTLIVGPMTGSMVALPLFALWFFSRGSWMGFGDVKLTLGMGWLLGPWGGFQALFLAFIVGGIVSAPLLFLSSSLWERIQRRFTPIGSSAKVSLGFTMKSEIPFGPFLIVATLIIWLLNMYGLLLGNFFA